MPYNQIDAIGRIVPSTDPADPNRKEICDIIEQALNTNDYSFSWSASNRTRAHLILVQTQ